MKIKKIKRKLITERILKIITQKNKKITIKKTLIRRRRPLKINLTMKIRKTGEKMEIKMIKRRKMIQKLPKTSE
jgi:hypothetical protein